MREFLQMEPIAILIMDSVAIWTMEIIAIYKLESIVLLTMEWTLQILQHVLQMIKLIAYRIEEICAPHKIFWIAISL